MDYRGGAQRACLYVCHSGLVPLLIFYSAVTAEEIQQFIPKLLSEVNMRILVTGNIYKDVRTLSSLFFPGGGSDFFFGLQEAIKIAEIAEQGLGQSALTPTQLNERALVLPDGKDFIHYL
jgi:insulysin